MGQSESVSLGFVVEVVQGDVFEFRADVLAVKSSPNSGGLDTRIWSRLRSLGTLTTSETDLKVGDYHLWPGDKIVPSSLILMVGAPSVYDLHYAQIRQLGRDFLEALWNSDTGVEHLAMTAHGIQTALGLDEVEAFRSLLLGMADAYQAGHTPATLKRVTFVEFSPKRAALFREALAEFLVTPPPPAPRGVMRTREAVQREEAARIAGPESFEPEFRKPAADDSTPFVFVAMPFREDYDDQFYLAIQPCVKEVGLLCERMDLDVFTGDITDRMFQRIAAARLVIALLDGGNPNVYLELGYAWGVRTSTVLLAHKEEPLPFDVRPPRADLRPDLPVEGYAASGTRPAAGAVIVSAAVAVSRPPFL